MVNRRGGTCLVLGGAATLHEDINAAKESFDFQGCVACNDAGAEWPGELDAWVTLHPQFWMKKEWLAKRAANGYPPARRLMTNNLADVRPWHPDLDIAEVDYRFPGQEHSGSSGMFAAKVALIDLGFDRAVLCGIPMSPMAHFHGADHWRADDKGRPSPLPNRYLQRWADVPGEYKARIRSMSGATRDLFG